MNRKDFWHMYLSPRISIIRRVVISVLLAVMLLVLPLSTIFAASTPPTKTANAATPMHIASTKPSASCPQPNRHQDISTLTLQERLDQGYPLPVHGKTDPKIDRIIHDKGVHFCRDTDTSSLATANSSSLWSGNMATSEEYTLIEANWTVSCIAWGTNDHYATWVGLGGNGNRNLVQTGTEGDNYPLSHGYYAWVENLATQPSEDEVFGVNCNDSMYAEVWGGNCMYIADNTTGATSGTVCTGPNANPYTAECIVERPTFGSSDSYLSNFGTEKFTGCFAETSGSGGGINVFPHLYYNIVDGNKTLLASPGPISNNDTFTVSWHSYGCAC